MTTHVIMNVDRPNGSGGTYKAGVEYDLPDDLAALWRGQGVCRLTSVRSEQTGAVITASSGNFPDAPAQNKRLPVDYTTNSDGRITSLKGGIAEIKTRRKFQGIRMFGGRLEYDFDNTTPNSWEDIIAIPVEFDSVEVVLGQGCNSGLTTATPSCICRIAFLPDPSYAAADAADWSTSVVYNGSLSIAMPKGSAFQRRGLKVCDPTPSASLPKDNGGYCYLAIRTWINGGNPLTLSGNLLGTEGYGPWRTHANGRIWKRRRRPGDCVSTNQANFSALAVECDDSPVVGVRYTSRERVVTVCAVGDSIFTGVGGSRYRCEGFVGRSVFEMPASDGVYEFMQLIWPGHSAATYRNHITDAILAGLVPDIGVFCAWSPNEELSTVTADGIRKARGYSAQIYAAFAKAGSVPIEVSPLPVDYSQRPYGATDALRSAWGVAVENSKDMLVVPASTLLAGSIGTGGQILPLVGTSYDGIHQNTASELILMPFTQDRIRVATCI